MSDNERVLALVMKQFDEHRDEDREQFAAINKKLDALAAMVNSINGDRRFDAGARKGALWVVGMAGGIAATVVSWIISALGTHVGK